MYARDARTDPNRRTAGHQRPPAQPPPRLPTCHHGLTLFGEVGTLFGEVGLGCARGKCGTAIAPDTPHPRSTTALRFVGESRLCVPEVKWQCGTIYNRIYNRTCPQRGEGDPHRLDVAAGHGGQPVRTFASD